MLTGEIKEMAKVSTGLNDEQIEQLHPGYEKLFNNVAKTMQFQTVAEVVKSEHCFAKVQVGDKIVFDPFLNPEKSTGVMCPKALLPLLSLIGGIWEMSGEWAESGREELPELIWRNVRCLDPGFEDGGVGGVVYSIRMEKIEA